MVADLDRNHLVSALELAPNVNTSLSSDVILSMPNHNIENKAFRFFETEVLPYP